MNGRIDAIGRPLLPIAIQSLTGAQEIKIEAWIDTGFTSALLLPVAVVQHADLVQTGVTRAELADGSSRVLALHECRIEWMGEERTVQCITAPIRDALLGIELLQDARVILDFQSRTVAIE